MEVRDMTIEEMKDLIDRKNTEIAKLTTALGEQLQWAGEVVNLLK